MVTLDETQRAAVAQAVRAAERKTSAEIVPVLARESGRHDRAEDAFGFVLGLLSVAAVWLLWPHEAESGSWSGPPAYVELIALLAAMIVGTALGTALAIRVPVLRRLAILPAQMRAEVEAAARALFVARRIHHTKERDAVMIYVSLFERTVHVLPDQSVEDKLGAEAIARVCDAITGTLTREGDPSAALIAGITQLGEALAEVMPGDGSDANEIEDDLVVLDHRWL